MGPIRKIAAGLLDIISTPNECCRNSGGTVIPRQGFLALPREIKWLLVTVGVGVRAEQESAPLFSHETIREAESVQRTMPAGIRLLPTQRNMCPVV
jgi:hypothetical protein